MTLTAKQEAFSQAIVSGLSQADAYRKAYDAGNMKPETVQNKAHVLMKNGEITARIAELRAPVVAKLQYGLEQAMEECSEAMDLAREKGQPSAFVSAINLRAKLHGLFEAHNKQAGEAAVNALGDLLKGMQKSSLPVVTDPE